MLFISIFEVLINLFISFFVGVIHGEQGAGRSSFSIDD